MRFSVPVAWLLFIGGFALTLGVVSYSRPESVLFAILWVNLAFIPFAIGALALGAHYRRKK